MPKREAHFGYLLTALIAYLILGPVARETLGVMNGLILMIALSSVLVIGIFSLQESRTLFISGIVLASLAVSFSILDYFIPNNGIIIVIALTAIFIFFIISIKLAASQLFARDGGPVTLNRIMGGICIYILLGMCWSIVYMYLIWLQPDAINGAHIDTEGSPASWDLIYFSFVTLTTLGYGDMTPVTPFARALAYTQAIVGQLYIAIFIGSLVGTYASRVVAKD